MIFRTFAALILLVAGSLPVAAHSQSFGFLALASMDDGLTGQLDLAIRDLDMAFTLDGNQDGTITWGEVRALEPTLSADLISGISVSGNGGLCALVARPLQIDHRDGENYLVQPFASDCQAGSAISVSDNLLFDLDSQHRLIVSLVSEGTSATTVLTAENRQANLSVAAGTSHFLDSFLPFVGSGIHHIWIGYDHILFIVTLILGATVVWGAGGWSSVKTLRPALFEVARVTTAFTIAHSLTLALAVLNVVRPPSVVIEAVIAVTITLTALNIVWPVITRHLWLIAFGFGLIHGFGFANVLAEMDLPKLQLVSALVGFNVGVELGQLSIVAVLLPILVIASRQRFYIRWALPAASLAIAIIGGLWFIDRSFGIAIMPFG